MVEIRQAFESQNSLLPQQSLDQYITHILNNKSSLDVVSINLEGKSDIADAMIIASGTSTTHIGSLANYVVKAFEQAGVEVFSVEGCPQNRWVLIDTAEIIVHIFHPDEREVYNLEKMWGADFFDEKNAEILH